MSGLGLFCMWFGGGFKGVCFAWHMSGLGSLGLVLPWHYKVLGIVQRTGIGCVPDQRHKV
eukprot:5306756-Amphidinium_carterae.1